MSLVVHDWGAVGLAFAQRHPERVERLVIINAVPFLPGYRWHRTARIWRTPGLGELAMGTTNRFTLRLASRESNATPGPMPEAWLDSVLDHFDQGTQRAILRLYRSSPPRRARGGRRAARSARRCPRWSCGACRTPTSRRASVASTRRRCRTPSWSSSPTPGTGRGSTARTSLDRVVELPERRVSASAPPGAGAGHPPRARSRSPIPAWTITAALAVVYLIAAPPSADLAAASYRSDLFARVGFTLWDNSWYGGHHLPAYSLLAPALGALLGPRLLAALSMTRRHRAVRDADRRPLPGARHAHRRASWFALGAAIALLSSRVPFDLGLALGLGALLLAQRDRLATRARAGVLASLASPVAGAFLALAFARLGARRARARMAGRAHARARSRRSRCSRSPSPKAARQPFVASAFYPALAGVLADRRADPAASSACCGSAAALYALALTASYVVPTAVGGNADRLGALVAGPVAACVLAGASRGRRACCSCSRRSCSTGRSTRPSADFASARRRPVRERLLLRAAARRAARARRRLRRAPGAHRGGRRPPTTGRRAGSPPT